MRKNAVFAVYSIYQDHESLIPDAPELLDTFLAAVRPLESSLHVPPVGVHHDVG